MNDIIGRALANLRIPLSQKGIANGVATLGVDGKLPSAQSVANVDLWETIKIVDITNTTSVSISTDLAGLAFSLKSAKLIAIFPSGVGDKTDGLSAFTIKINDITGINIYNYSATFTTSGWGTSGGNLSCNFILDIYAKGNQIHGMLVRQAVYGAVWPGTSSSSSISVLTNTNVGFADINKITITSSGGTSESNMHTGGYIILKGIRS
jgi:hypothetical protein